MPAYGDAGMRVTLYSYRTFIIIIIITDIPSCPFTDNFGYPILSVRTTWDEDNMGYNIYKGYLGDIKG